MKWTSSKWPPVSIAAGMTTLLLAASASDAGKPLGWCALAGVAGLLMLAAGAKGQKKAAHRAATRKNGKRLRKTPVHIVTRQKSGVNHERVV